MVGNDSVKRAKFRDNPEYLLGHTTPSAQTLDELSDHLTSEVVTEVSLDSGL